jgi:thioredoxin 1
MKLGSSAAKVSFATSVPSGFIARLARTLSALLLVAASAGAGAGEWTFDRAAFDKAVASGRPVIVHIAATWCPTCKAQKPLVDALLREPKRKGMAFFKADYDTESALKQRLRVSQQSTFVVFKAGKEVGRSTGETSKEAIAALFDKAL